MVFTNDLNVSVMLVFTFIHFAFGLKMCITLNSINCL